MEKETKYMLVNKTLIDIEDIQDIILLGTTNDENKVPYVRIVFNEELQDYFEGFTSKEELNRVIEIRKR